MWKLLGSLLGRPEPARQILPDHSPTELPPERIGIFLPQINGAFILEDGLPRPQWQVVRKCIESRTPGEVVEDWIAARSGKKTVSPREQAWHEAAHSWLSTLGEALGPEYGVHSAGDFLLLTDKGRTSVRYLLENAQRTVSLLEHWLGPLARKHGTGPHALLAFGQEAAYYRYLEYFYPDEQTILPTSGVFLHGTGYHHIALAPSPQILFTLVHELTHNRLAHLDLPRWLNEGIAMVMEKQISGHHRTDLDRWAYREHSQYWTPETIQGFWNGTSFFEAEDRAQHLSYSLAQTLVSTLAEEFSDFASFVADAKASDAGEASAHQHLGLSLSDAAASFLGEGDWKPQLTLDQGDPV